MEKPTNSEIANTLARIADLLEAQDAEYFRVRAYRSGAQTIRQTEQPIADLTTEALEAIPTIGPTQARLINELVTTGHINLLDRLEGEFSAENLFARVPGIGDELAKRIVDTLDIHSLQELEASAHDGRLRQVSGFGPRRIQALRAALAGMLSNTAQRRKQNRLKEEGITPRSDRPSIDLLLSIDAEYRAKAKAGELKMIAPRRFNPNNEAWLPIMHVERDGWNFTAMFSNTARAHELEKTQDWVVIYYERNGDEHQHTIVTETSGPLKDKRVVRGREIECQRYYEAAAV